MHFFTSSVTLGYHTVTTVDSRQNCNYQICITSSVCPRPWLSSTRLCMANREFCSRCHCATPL